MTLQKPPCCGKGGGGPFLLLPANPQPSLQRSPGRAISAGAVVGRRHGGTLQNLSVLKCSEPVWCMLSAMGESNQASSAMNAAPRAGLRKTRCQNTGSMYLCPPAMATTLDGPIPAAPTRLSSRHTPNSWCAALEVTQHSQFHDALQVHKRTSISTATGGVICKITAASLMDFCGWWQHRESLLGPSAAPAGHEEEIHAVRWRPATRGLVHAGSVCNCTPCWIIQV